MTEYNKNKNGIGKCILFAPQDDDCMKKKNLFANLTAVINRMVDLKETNLFKDFPGEVRFEQNIRHAFPRLCRRQVSADGGSATS